MCKGYLIPRVLYFAFLSIYLFHLSFLQSVQLFCLNENSLAHRGYDDLPPQQLAGNMLALFVALFVVVAAYGLTKREWKRPADSMLIKWSCEEPHPRPKELLSNCDVIISIFSNLLLLLKITFEIGHPFCVLLTPPFCKTLISNALTINFYPHATMRLLWYLKRFSPHQK